MSKTDKDMLRHTLATLSYRVARIVKLAPETYADFLPGPTSNTPLTIMGHMGDLFDWAFTMISGKPTWHTSKPKNWESECQRFFNALKKFDDAMASDTHINFELERMFQGPVADALTHTGQLAMILRLCGSPMKGENYSRADIRIGNIGLQ